MTIRYGRRTFVRTGPQSLNPGSAPAHTEPDVKEEKQDNAIFVCIDA